MKRSLIVIAFACVWISLQDRVSWAEPREFKLGVLYSLTGAYAPVGALAVAAYQGTMVAVDMINARGGIAGEYRVVPVVADAGSKAEIAVKEGLRLMKEADVPVVVGLYASQLAEAVAPLAEEHQKVLWLTVAISDAVLKDLHRKYVFRVRPPGSMWGRTSVRFLKDNWNKFGRENPKDVRVAVIHEEGSFGSTIGETCVRRTAKYGFNLVTREKYSTKQDGLAVTMSGLVGKLKKAAPDVILLTGFFDDTVQFFRESAVQQLKCKAVIAHGGGASNVKALEQAAGKDAVQNLFVVDTVSAQLFDPSKMKASQGDVIKEFLDRYEKRFHDTNPSSHAMAGFSYTWVLLNDVLPRALKKHGKLDTESIRQTASEIYISAEDTTCGFGVKFAGQDDQYAGQNLHARPAVLQWRNGKLAITWPESIRTADPAIPSDAPQPALGN